MAQPIFKQNRFLSLIPCRLHSDNKRMRKQFFLRSFPPLKVNNTVISGNPSQDDVAFAFAFTPCKHTLKNVGLNSLFAQQLFI